MLRRHHCRRCGNVFCDACSSARMPLINTDFCTPVRVCVNCCIAAKKAHAKMVQERYTFQPIRRYSETNRIDGMTFDEMEISNGDKIRK
ncbi:unnamed protein product [Peronospora effusa]|nr:unnamed protein product [Peronospora effusa]